MDSLQLHRIEHKLDLIIRAMQTKELMSPDLPDLEHSDVDECPVCNTRYRWQIDVASETTRKICACRPSVQAVPGISALLNPPDPQESYHAEEDSEPTPEGTNPTGPG